MKQGPPLFFILICQRDVFLTFRCKTDHHIYSLLNHNLLKFNRSYFFVQNFDDFDRDGEEKNDKNFWPVNYLRICKAKKQKSK